MNWIDVRDRLPDDDTCVIVAGDREALTVAWHDEDDGTWNDMDGRTVEGVEFWMPLPPVPGPELADN